MKDCTKSTFNGESSGGVNIEIIGSPYVLVNKMIENGDECSPKWTYHKVWVEEKSILYGADGEYTILNNKIYKVFRVK